MIIIIIKRKNSAGGPSKIELDIAHKNSLSECYNLFSAQFYMIGTDIHWLKFVCEIHIHV